MASQITTLRQRFDAKWVIWPPTGCWIWLSTIHRKGYGEISVAGRGTWKQKAHRVAYELYVGPIPVGLQIDHLCRVRCCVNPEHLEPVTSQVNCSRGDTGKFTSAWQRSKTSCPAGHPYNEENTYRRPNGSRKCRVCNRLRETSRRP